MQQIKALLKENDIAGIVILHTIEGEAIVKKTSTHVQGFTEYMVQLSPSYSAAKLENERLTVLGKVANYPSLEVRNIRIAGTVNMLEHLSLWTGRIALNIMDIEKEVQAMVEHTGDDENPTHTTDTQQNN